MSDFIGWYEPNISDVYNKEKYDQLIHKDAHPAGLLGFVDDIRKRKNLPSGLSGNHGDMRIQLLPDPTDIRNDEKYRNFK